MGQRVRTGEAKMGMVKKDMINRMMDMIKVMEAVSEEAAEGNDTVVLKGPILLVCNLEQRKLLDRMQAQVLHLYQLDPEPSRLYLPISQLGQEEEEEVHQPRFQKVQEAVEANQVPTIEIRMLLVQPIMGMDWIMETNLPRAAEEAAAGKGRGGQEAVEEEKTIRMNQKMSFSAHEGGQEVIPIEVEVGASCWSWDCCSCICCCS